jgi:hypothetical protein
MLIVFPPTTSELLLQLTFYTNFLLYPFLVHVLTILTQLGRRRQLGKRHKL